MHVKWMLSKINIEQNFQDQPITCLKEILCILSIDLHSRMELVHFPELSSLWEKEHGFKELCISLLNHHPGSEGENGCHPMLCHITRQDNFIQCQCQDIFIRFSMLKGLRYIYQILFKNDLTWGSVEEAGCTWAESCRHFRTWPESWRACRKTGSASSSAQGCSRTEKQIVSWTVSLDSESSPHCHSSATSWSWASEPSAFSQAPRCWPSGEGRGRHRRAWTGSTPASSSCRASCSAQSPRTCWRPTLSPGIHDKIIRFGLSSKCFMYKTVIEYFLNLVLKREGVTIKNCS